MRRASHRRRSRSSTTARLSVRRTLDAWATRPGRLWRFRELLPAPADAPVLSLAEGATPLVRLKSTPVYRIWLKDETRNPTGSFKDRLHAGSLTLTRVLGQVVHQTGRHGGTSHWTLWSPGDPRAARTDRSAPRCLT